MQKDLSLTCSLPGPALSERSAAVSRDILRHAKRSTPLEDGYELQFPGDNGWLSKLTEFVAFERQCCGGLHFELIFQPNYGPILLRLRGGAQVKEFIEGLFKPA